MSIFDAFRNKVDVATDSPSKTMTGRIIKIHPKGYGFITSEDKPFTRIFFHWTALKQDTVKFPELIKDGVGKTVEFELQAVPDKGFRAVRIMVK